MMTLFDNTRILEMNVESIASSLEEIKEYVSLVNEGKIEGDPRIGRLLTQALSSVSQVDPSEAQKMLPEHY